MFSCPSSDGIVLGLCEVEVFETSRNGTLPRGVVGVLPPRLGLPVALAGLLSPRPLPGTDEIVSLVWKRVLGNLGG